jgi:hypothetical protein
MSDKGPGAGDVSPNWKALLGAGTLCMVLAQVWAADAPVPGASNAVDVKSRPLSPQQAEAFPQPAMGAADCAQPRPAEVRIAQACPPGTCPCQLGGCSQGCCP